MVKKLWFLIAVLLGLVFFKGSAFAASAEELYKGKTIRFIVGFAAGGGFDTYTRMIARHFGKHVPGNPSVLVENMTGAGSMIAAGSTSVARLPTISSRRKPVCRSKAALTSRKR